MFSESVAINIDLQSLQIDRFDNFVAIYPPIVFATFSLSLSRLHSKIALLSAFNNSDSSSLTAGTTCFFSPLPKN